MKHFFNNLLLVSSIILIWMLIFPGWVIREIIFRTKK